MPSSIAAWELQQIIYKYWSAVERYQYDDALALLSEDVEFDLGAGLRGREAVAAALSKRPTTAFVRHLVSNVIVEEAAGTIRASYILTSFGLVAREGENPPFPSAPPEVVADGEIVIDTQGERPLITRLSGRPLFRAKH